VGKSLHVMGPQFSHPKKQAEFLSLRVLMGSQRDYAYNLISILSDIRYKETVTIIVIITIVVHGYG